MCFGSVVQSRGTKRKEAEEEERVESVKSKKKAGVLLMVVGIALMIQVR